MKRKMCSNCKVILKEEGDTYKSVADGQDRCSYCGDDYFLEIDLK